MKIFACGGSAATQPIVTKTIAQIISSRIDDFLRFSSCFDDAICNLKVRMNNPEFSQFTVSSIIQDWKNEMLDKEYKSVASCEFFNSATGIMLNSLHQQKKLANDLELIFGNEKPTNLKDSGEVNKLIIDFYQKNPGYHYI